MRIFHPYRKNSFLDRAAARFKDYFFNHYILENISKTSPKIKGTLDFIGLDYYTRELTRLDILKPAQLIRESKINRGDVSDLGWEIYPRGIYLSLLKLKKYGVPIIITENGLANREDSRRSQFIIDHLIQVHRAIEEGVDVRGYLHWSLMDNFEWAEGFRACFGLVEVDYATQKRSTRASAYTFAKICKTNQILL
jgi:beta-glucosidase